MTETELSSESVPAVETELNSEALPMAQAELNAKRPQLDAASSNSESLTLAETELNSKSSHLAEAELNLESSIESARSRDKRVNLFPQGQSKLPCGAPTLAKTDRKRSRFADKNDEYRRPSKQLGINVVASSFEIRYF